MASHAGWGARREAQGHDNNDLGRQAHPPLPRPWPVIGRFLITLSATGLTGLLAALAAVLLAGTLTTIRRVTV